MSQIKTDLEILTELQQLAYMYGLNSIVRYNLTREEKHQTQSVAEHVANILACAYFFKDIIVDGKKLNMHVVSRRILLHDIGEIETGDILTTKKNSEDSKKEHGIIAEVAKKIPHTIAQNLIPDYEAIEHKTDIEGRFVYAMDKFEGFFFQAMVADLQMIRSVTKDIEVRRKYIEGIDAVMVENGFPELTSYTQVARKDAIHRGYLKN